MERKQIVINGTATNHFIDMLGRVTTKNGVQLRTPITNGRMYYSNTTDGVNLSRRLDYIVTDAFLPKPPNAVRLIHYDHDEFNCSVDNLYWITSDEIIERNVENGMDISAINKEKWKSIDTPMGTLSVSSFGRVKDNNGSLIGQKDSFGYKVIYYVANGTRKETKSLNVHRLVAEAFIPNPNGYAIVNHMDNNKANNRISNLEWCNISMNTEHGALYTDTTRLNRVYVEKAAKLMSEGHLSDVEISRITGIHRKTLSDMRQHRRHADIMSKYELPQKRWSKELSMQIIDLINAGYKGKEVLRKLGIEPIDQAAISFYERTRRDYHHLIKQ